MNINEYVGTGQILIIILALAVSTFFTMCDAAFHSISPLRLNIMLESEMKGATTVEKLLKKPKDLFVGLAFTKVLAMITATILTAEIFISHYGDKPFVLAIIILVIGMILLLLGELLPKRIGNSIPKTIACKTSGFIRIWIFLLTPFNYILNFIAHWVLKAINLSDKEKPVVTENELRAFIHLSSEEGILNEEKKNMIHNVFNFDDAQAKDIMVPRMEIEAVPIDISWEDLIDFVSDNEFSRYPIYEDDLDHIIGLFYVKDLIFARAYNDTFSLRDYIREPYFSFEQKIIGELFQEMRENRIPMTIILDEYGGTAGIITLEDLIEEIVGDIFDEYDIERPAITSFTENEYIVKAGMRLDDVNDETGLSLESETYETIGGYVMEKIGKIPEKGAVVVGEHTTFTVLSVEKNKIERIRIQVDPTYIDLPTKEVEKAAEEKETE